MKHTNTYNVVFLEKTGHTYKERRVSVMAVNRIEAVILTKKDYEVLRIKSIDCIEDGNVKQKEIF